ncbi:tetratricopeptide repeat protein [Acidocella sp.]|uniref:SEL1-like repeat protein n=1 Tax=Acidocella sp. TaxID=50710 RepID=UPI0026121DE2|nr:tetratricopeptide repeat protein [Acidocella sp.]
MLKQLADTAADRLAARSPAAALARAEALLAVGEMARAVKLLGVAADAGLAEAQYLLGLRYMLGEGVAPSPEQAGLWFHRAAMDGHAGAQVKLAALHLAGLPGDVLTEAGLFAPSRTRVDFAAAAHWAERAAQAGNAEAITLLAFILSVAPPPWRNEIYAGRLYEVAAAKGNAQAQFALGLLRLRQSRAEEGVALVGRAALAGLPHAHDALGALYENAVGTPQDFVRAAEHYRIAAQAGIARAMARYGLALLLGRGAAKDTLNAETWLRKAALAGNAEAALRLGKLYAEPGELPPNDAEATLWFTRAAEAGSAEAAAALGVFALDGRGTVRDPARAVAWFRRAADAGDVTAAHNLANCLARGIGTVADAGEAAFWAARARQGGAASGPQG